ncbi:FKBP-type peptidyl-prolyl cis-trans isomerase [uncultured Algimonas sp.]|uniref:FKBP-type peptidyl-prolyl cis-trans isomerase n=1 Tax=uncultured Algimonas sp. TaxID=1547920 RepID=UPI002616FFEE|nr:FKBP-type peptidyl-prolyl cis-trans isomerase [uncultured Algimonas sp.]
MTRFLAAISTAALLAACTASSDDVGELGENDAPGVAEMVSVCPDNLVLDLDGYADETLPEAEDYNAWHMENAERPDVQQTASGMQYKVIQPGMENGMTPRPGEEVIAMYHGYRTDGTVFDSSYERDEPFIFPTDRVIAGWTEAVESMKVCEARTLYLPANLAYGERGAGEDIRPGDTLVFNMQLIRVNREGLDDAVGVED